MGLCLWFRASGLAESLHTLENPTNPSKGILLGPGKEVGVHIRGHEPGSKAKL